jgi:hypothetical protein
MWETSILSSKKEGRPTEELRKELEIATEGIC